MGHMQKGSVRVAAGESIGVGVPLGSVGNTGNTDEAHLHIHAQRPGTLEQPISGEPVLMRLDGRYLWRNQRITRNSSAAPEED
jgi:murein DD-endopeptidase MepM/ murein hydrolase activator NlpD